MPSKRPHVTVRMDPAVKRAYERFAQRTGFSMSEVIEGLLIDMIPVLRDLEELLVKARSTTDRGREQLLDQYGRRTMWRLASLATERPPEDGAGPFYDQSSLQKGKFYKGKGTDS